VISDPFVVRNQFNKAQNGCTFVIFSIRVWECENRVKQKITDKQ